MASDGPAFVAAAVRAACLAHAPRRTVQAVAAAVAGVFAHPPAARAAPPTVAEVPTRAHRAAEPAEGKTPEELLEALRSARVAQRRRKKERRRVRQAACTKTAREEADAPAGANGGGQLQPAGSDAAAASRPMEVVTLNAGTDNFALREDNAQQMVTDGDEGTPGPRVSFASLTPKNLQSAHTGAELHSIAIASKSSGSGHTRSSALPDEAGPYKPVGQQRRRRSRSKKGRKQG